jgi:hypothetical protein
MKTKIFNTKMSVVQGDALSRITTFNIGSGPVRNILSKVTTFYINSSLIYAVEDASEPDTPGKDLLTDNFACNRQCMTCIRTKKLTPVNLDF